MTSIIAWLDTSAEEQRRVRELIMLFAETESRDELGIGQIRDAFSETLFPGTSVIQTRARYFLFVPWIFRDGARSHSGLQLSAWADGKQRKLIAALREAGGDISGLIGGRAGIAVKTLPSTIYWSGLARYGILTHDVATDRLGRAGSGSATSAVEDAELAARVVDDWNATLPPPPAGFPDRVNGGFSMRPDEATWLSEQIRKTTEGTILAYLLAASTPMPDPDSEFPWADSACVAAPAPTRDQLEHARLFSLGMHGAALLYNLLIGELYESAGHTRIEDPAARSRELLGKWAGECADSAPQLASWDRKEMWNLVMHANPRVSLGTRTFVDTWLDAIADGHLDKVADSPPLRDLVASREQRQKRAQSRLTNPRLLRTWSGESGSAQLAFRWPQVRRIVTDIRDGADRDARA